MSGGEIVAKLRYPMPAGAMLRLAKALEELYGEGAVVDFGSPEALAEPGWMIVRKPS